MQWQTVLSRAFSASTWDWLIDRFHTLVIYSSYWLYTSCGVLSGSVSGDYSTWLTPGRGPGVVQGTTFCWSKFEVQCWGEKKQVLNMSKQKATIRTVVIACSFHVALCRSGSINIADCCSWLGASCTSEFKYSVNTTHLGKPFCYFDTLCDVR